MEQQELHEKLELQELGGISGGAGGFLPAPSLSYLFIRRAGALERRGSAATDAAILYCAPTHNGE